MHVFLGITGASGAPYAARLLEALAAADCEIGVAASSAGIEVLATELYGNARLARDETITRLLEHAPNATVYDPNDWKAPYASGSAKVDAYVICPCSMGTLGTIASGAMQNVIHRAASVAIKEERRLVLMLRETPLSAIHLRNMLTLREAGATILFLAPGFYHGAETVDDLVDFVVARALDQLGLENVAAKRWGQQWSRRAACRPPACGAWSTGSWRSRARAARSRRSTGSGSIGLCQRSAASSRVVPHTPTCRRAYAASPARRSSRRASRRPASPPYGCASSPGVSSPCTWLRRVSDEPGRDPGGAAPRDGSRRDL